mmetsp:Transcript_14707/g.34914  ORF Transcript_14707/g.34914 Transcript_14707/m.34914 type:complete len:278 (+) Transcript_14707:1158-1991(+)
MRPPKGVRVLEGAVLVVLGLDLGVEERSVVGLHHADLGLRRLRTQRLRHALKRPAGAVGAYEVVELLVAHSVDDLRAGGLGVDPRVGLVLELAREEPAVLFGKVLGLDQHARRLVRRVRQHHLGAEEAHELAALDREALGHDAHEGVPLDRAHHCQPNPGVSARSLDYSLSRFDFAVLLCPLDDAECQSVLDTSHRVERLALQVHVDPLGRHLLQLHQRRLPYGRQNAVVQECRQRVLNLRWARRGLIDTPFLSLDLLQLSFQLRDFGLELRHVRHA